MLPFFVYGTLLEGEANAHHWKRAVAERHIAWLEGAQLWDLGPYPMLVRGAGEVCGELVHIEAARYQQVLRVLDRLEGVRSDAPTTPGGLFHRERVRVRVAQTVAEAHARVHAQVHVEAWAYFGRDTIAKRGRWLETGDWRRRFARDTRLSAIDAQSD